jgi:hypothetical protein
MPIDVTLNTQGQQYFKAGYLLVGNVPYANYITDGVDDQVQIQAAIDAASTGAIKEVLIISPMNVRVNEAYTEVIGGFNRKIAVKLLSGVHVTIMTGVPISFPSGGDSSGTPIYVFGNHGNLENCSVTCKGDNAFDGNSTIGGTLGSRGGAVSLDCRSNSCTSLTDNVFTISGKRTGGSLFYAYNSNGVGTSVAKKNKVTILLSTQCLSAVELDRGGDTWDVSVNRCESSRGDGIVISNGLQNTKVMAGVIKNSFLNGFKSFIAPTLSTVFNDLDISINSVELSSQHNISIGGTNGIVSARTEKAQKHGLFLDTTLLTGTYYWPTKLILNNLISLNNNQSGGSFSGVGGIGKNIELVNFETSDNQNVPTQYRGVDLTDTKNDYISLIGGVAKNNVNSTQIAIYGVNSSVYKDVVGYTTIFDVASTKTITSAETIYLLDAGDILTLPRFTDCDSTLPKVYEIQCSSGTAEVKAAQEIDLSYKPINAYPAGVSLYLTAGQSVKIIKLANRWQTLGDTTASVANVTALTGQNATVITTSSTYITVNNASTVDSPTGVYSKTVPLSTTMLGRTLEFKKISKDFKLTTFNLSGSDKIEDLNTPLDTPTRTNFKMAIPGEVVKITCVSAGLWRVERNAPIASLKTIAYRPTSTQNTTFGGTLSVPKDFVCDMIAYTDTIAAIDSTKGWTATTDCWVAPFDCQVFVVSDFGVVSTSVCICDTVVEKSFAAAPTIYVELDYQMLGGVVRTQTANLRESSSCRGTINLLAGDTLRVRFRNYSSAIAGIENSTPSEIGNNTRPQRSFIEIKIENTLY